MEEEENVAYRERDTPLTEDEEAMIRFKLDLISENHGMYYIYYKEDMSRLLNAYRRLRKEVGHG